MHTRCSKKGNQLYNYFIMHIFVILLCIILHCIRYSIFQFFSAIMGKIFFATCYSINNFTFSVTLLFTKLFLCYTLNYRLVEEDKIQSTIVLGTCTKMNHLSTNHKFVKDMKNPSFFKPKRLKRTS